jgi:cytochrome b6-f complex iron-sulfur subunit
MVSTGRSVETKRSSEKPSEELSRREFFEKVGASSLMLAGAGTVLFAYEYMSPNVLYEPSPIVNAGKPEQYPLDSMTLDPANGIYVVRASEGLYALSAICPHLGCLTTWNPDLNVVACPCHGSKFRRDGTRIEGPAPASLKRLRMWLSDTGNLMVDRSKIVAAHEYVRL